MLLKLNIPDDQFDYARFLYNIIFDPREDFDLVGQGIAIDEALGRLIATYYGALESRPAGR